jgi:hypothetical protein
VRTIVLNFGEGKLPHLAGLSYFKLTLLSCNDGGDGDGGIYKSAFPNILQQFAV